MSDYVESVLVENVAIMRSQLESSSDEDGLIPAISSWLEGDAQVSQALKQTILAHIAASRSYRAVAAAGFLIAAGTKDEEIIKFFNSGSEWLLRRALIVDGVPTGVAVDGLAVLNFLGQLKVGVKNGIKEWVASVNDAEAKRMDAEPVSRTSLQISCALLNFDIYTYTERCSRALPVSTCKSNSESRERHASIFMRSTISESANVAGRQNGE